MKYQIRFVKGELADSVYPIENDSVSIGRSRSNDIVLATPDISRKHVIISNKGRGLFIDNLSSRLTTYGTTELKIGDSVPFAVNIEVTIGKENSFVLESYNNVDADDKTVYPSDDATTLEQKTIYETLDAAPLHPQATGANSASGLEGNEVNELAEFEAEQTVGLKTRFATPEEIQMVKDTEKKKLTIKYISWGIAAAVVFTLLSVYYYFTLYKAPEPTILWPESNGELCVGYAKIKDDNFPFCNDLQLAFPVSDATQINQTPGMLEVITFTGKYMDVPCFIRLEYSKNRKGLKIGRRMALDAWTDSKSSGKNSWNFDVASPVSFFLQDNGIPHYSVSYTRTAPQGSYCGLARFFRYEDWQFALTVEIPANEKWRGSGFLNKNFIQFSNNFLHSHWEGMEDIGVIDKAANLYEAKILLSRESVSLWRRIEYLLKSTLIACDKEKDVEQYQEAKALLVTLRGEQIKWFNEQKIAYILAANLDDKDKMKKITDHCKAIFSSPEDKRFHTVRQDNWR